MRTLSDHHVTKEDLAAVKSTADAALQDAGAALATAIGAKNNDRVILLISTVSLAISLGLATTIFFLHF